MSNPSNQTNPRDDDSQPRGRGDRIFAAVIAVIALVLALAIWADTPASASTGDRALSVYFLRFVIVVVVGGFLYSSWKRSPPSR